MKNLVRFALGLSLAAVLVLQSPSGGDSAPVASSAEAYALCGRVFPDPHAFWPAPAQAPGRSPFAKGNVSCPAVDFLSYDDMVKGAEYLETLFPQFVQFSKLERDFGDGTDCTASTSNADLCSAGLPQAGFPAGRKKSDLYLLRVSDERVPDADKKFFTFPLSIHGIERAGAEAGVRAAEDLATWAACEGGAAPAVVTCAQEGAFPHPLLETTPEESVTAGDALRRSAIYFVFSNPDGWRRGDAQNGARFFQRYNGNGVDMNRDWPTLGFSFRPYTPWSEPETRGFGKVLKQIRPKWDGGIDLHGQLIDRAFSFTLLGAGEQDYSKNQRILQTVKGAWADAEKRLAWSPAIKPNTAAKDDPRLYGVQWGTVWDTIAYTTTGSLGDWINSPLGLDGDGIDNEMSLSHISNCGVGSCFLVDAEQLHVDGNKSLIYSMINFTLKPEDTDFRAPGSVAYVRSDKVVSNAGSTTGTGGSTLPPQPSIQNAALDAGNNFTYEFAVKGAAEGFSNGGLEGKATAVNVSGIGQLATTELILEKYRLDEEDPQNDSGCAGSEDAWEEINRYFDQSDVYQQAGATVVTNMPLPGRYRICMTGGLATKLRASGGSVDLDITFSREQAWEDPGQKPYSATNMKFFADLAGNMRPGQFTAVAANDVLSGAVDLNRFSSVVVADDAFPGDVEPVPTGAAQPGQTFDATAKTGATVPCAYQEGTTPVLPPTCVADFEFDVDPAFNNQQLSVAISAPNAIDYDLFLERQSRISGDWFAVGKSATEAASEVATLNRPLPGHYRARVVNWAAGAPADTVGIAFSNEYAGTPPGSSGRTDAERTAWGQKLRGFAERGGNLVLTDGAVRDLALMGVLPRGTINDFAVYAGYVAFTRDGRTSTYEDPLARNVNQPGAAEGPGFRHQTYEPVPIGYAISPDDEDTQLSSSPVWAVDQIAWEKVGGTTAGTTTADQVTLGELDLGRGVVRVIGALLPMPTEQYYHPFGLANYAVTYSGYQVFQNALQWERPLPDLALAAGDIAFTTAKDRSTITASVRNIGGASAADVVVRFADNGATIGDATIASIAAGASGTASVVWSTKGLKGERTITVTADPAQSIAESDESNNSASRVVVVKANKVQNGDFQASSNGSPDHWSSSGSTSYDGDAASAGPGGSWTSAPIEVVPGRAYGLSLDVTGAGAAVVQQLSAAGVLLASSPLAAALTPVAGVTQVRIVLNGGLGGATFDNVFMGENLDESPAEPPRPRDRRRRRDRRCGRDHR
ncbi:MAG: CARDB domain-containing protein [Gaiellaceae bacterium]